MNSLTRICLVGPIVVLAGCVSSTQIEIMAEEQFEEMRVQIPLSTSLRDKAYVRCVSRAIISQLEEPYASYDWDIELFDQEDINAFAMPGGKIGVLTGLLKVTENQDQLAAVIGHEIAHVTRDHSLKRANREMVTRNAASIGSEIVDVAYGIETTQLVMLGAELGLLRPYSRGNETEADIVGLRYMAKAGFDPRASVTLWTNMSKASPAGPPEWWSTHPSDDTRISQLARQMTNTLPLYNQARAAGRKPDCRR